MFDSEIKSFFDLLTCMMESQKGRKEEKVKKVFAFFDIPSKVLITSQSQLQKMAQLKPDRLQKINQLHINLPKNKNSFDIILADMHKILKNLRTQNIMLQCFSLNLSECNMLPKERLELVKDVRNIQAETKYVNVKQTLEDEAIYADEGDKIIDRVLNMKISSNSFLFSDEFILYRISNQEKMNKVTDFLNSHKIKTEKIENVNVNRHFYVNIQEECLYTFQQLKMLLDEKDESLVQLNIHLSEQSLSYQYIDQISLRFPQYLESFNYLQVNSSEQIDFQFFMKLLLKNLLENYNNGIVVNANFQYNQSASLIELLRYFLQLYKLESNFKIQTQHEIGSKKQQENEELDFSNFAFENEKVALNGINNQSNQQNILPSLKYQQSILIKEDHPVKLQEDVKLNDKMLFQCIKIDDSILIGCSKPYFNSDDILNYLHNEEGNYSCLFLLFEFGISQEFLYKLQAQLKEYFLQMNNIRHLHMIIGESGSFFIDLHQNFTFIENVLIIQNDLFQLKVPQKENNNSIHLESHASKKSYRFYTYADLVSDTYETDIDIANCDPYVQVILKTARRGLDVHKYCLQSELSNILTLQQDQNNQTEEKFNKSKIMFTQQEVYLPLELPPLSARLLPQALKQMNQIRKFSIYDNIDLDIQDFLQQNNDTLQYLKIKNSKIDRCNCGIKHQLKKSDFLENKCPDIANVVNINGIVYRSNQISLIDISNLKQLNYLNITQSLMYLYFDYQHLAQSITALTNKLQVVKLGFQKSNIHFTKEITDYLCNTSILHTFEINAIDNYKFIGLDHIIKGLSFNFLISNIGIRVSSHQISKQDMDQIKELLHKRRIKGQLKSFKFYIKKYNLSNPSQTQLSPEYILNFFNEVIENILKIDHVKKISLSYKNFNYTIKQQDLNNLNKLLFEKSYQKVKINLQGNIISNNFRIQDSEVVKMNNQISKLIFKCDKIEQLSNDHLIYRILSMEIPSKVLTLPYEILDNNKKRVLINGQRISLNLIAELSMDMINLLQFSSNINKLILDFKVNIYLLSDELIQLLQILIKENSQLKYLLINTPNKLFTAQEQTLIKQNLQKFKNFQPKQFIVK